MKHTYIFLNYLSICLDFLCPVLYNEANTREVGYESYRYIENHGGGL